MARLSAAAAVFGLTACPGRGADAPRPTGAAWSVGPDLVGDAPVRGIAVADQGALVVADQERARRLERGGAVSWTVALGASAGPAAIDGDVVAVVVSGAAGVGVPGLATGLRGEPGSALLGLGLVDGARRWTVGVGATRWVLATHVSANGDGFFVAGSFAGTLRVGDRTTTSAGVGDGFVASVDRAGAVRWLLRVGGDGADTIAGAAALGAGKIAIAGTFSGTAELRGETLIAHDPEVASADGFVAVLDAQGALVWHRIWGGPADDTCAGVVALDGGALAVAGTVRGEVDVAGRVLTVRGNADGLVAVFGPDAGVRGAYLVGGDDFDGITALAGSGDRVALAGWYTGTLPGPDGPLRADGIDDAYLAVGTAAGLIEVTPLASPGPAAVTALAGGPAGVGLAIHATTSARLDGTDRLAGASLWFRGW